MPSRRHFKGERPTRFAGVAVDCFYCTGNDPHIDTKERATTLFLHLRDQHAAAMAEGEVRSVLEVRAMTSGPPKFRDLWNPPKAKPPSTAKAVTRR